MPFLITNLCLSPFHLVHLHPGALVETLHLAVLRLQNLQARQDHPYHPQPFA